MFPCGQLRLAFLLHLAHVSFLRVCTFLSHSPPKKILHLISWKKYIFFKKNSWELPMGSKIKEKLKSLICKVTVTLNMECKK